jgi:hypothetical protein
MVRWFAVGGRWLAADASQHFHVDRERERLAVRELGGGAIGELVELGLGHSAQRLPDSAVGEWGHALIVVRGEGRSQCPKRKRKWTRVLRIR